MALIGLLRDGLSEIADLFDAVLQSPRPIPLAVADQVGSICAARPDSEILTWWLGERLPAEKLGRACGLPLLVGQRYGAAFKTLGGRGRVRLGEYGFARAVCLTLDAGTVEALRQANDIGRRAEKLLAAVPRDRTKGAGVVIQKLLDEDAVRSLRPDLVPDFWIVTMAGTSPAKSRRRTQSNMGDKRLLYRELEELPPELRWWEWMLRVEAMIFIATEPVSRETLTRGGGRKRLQHRSHHR